MLPLEHLGNISEIESVVAFAGGRQQILWNLEIDFDRGLHDRIRHFIQTLCGHKEPF